MKTTKPEIRYPAVAESFYPSEPSELKKTLATLLAEAPDAGLEAHNIRAILAPHAGYSFSGGVAAAAYGALQNRSFDTVYLIGNAHAYLFEGIALDGHDIWQSPLGRVPVDTALAHRLHELDPGLVQFLNIAHHSDHILEVHLPFLQSVLQPGFRILPLLFGENPPDLYRKASELLVRTVTPDDLIVASSDLSHYPCYKDACAIDRKTLDHVLRKDIKGLERHVRATMKKNIPQEDALFCGPDGLKTLLDIAARSDWQTRAMLYSNSGEALYEDKTAVVGYASVVFYES